jgi:chitinase
MREGLLSYYEICERVSTNLGWKEVWSKEDNLPYAYNSTEWIAYENVDSVKLKALYVIEKQLAGAMIYASDTDDFKGTFCYQGKNPLLSALKTEFANHAKSAKTSDKIKKLNAKKAKKEKLYVCYYTNWSQYRPTGGTFLPENINATLCTHIVFAFAQVVNDDIAPYEWNDADSDFSPGIIKFLCKIQNR